MLPLPKAPRFITVQAKKADDGPDDGGEASCAPMPIPNIFNKEVYFALNTRGGAIWERLHKDKQQRKDEEGHAQGCFGAMQTMDMNDAGVDYNARFNLTGSRCKIRFTLLKKISLQVERIAASKPKDDQTITRTEFIDACTAGGLGSLTQDQFGTMFSSIDKDESGQIDVAEWLAACKAGDKMAATTMAAKSEAGDATIEVASVEGFAVGDELSLGDETRIVANVDDARSMMTLDPPLEKDYKIGVAVSVIKKGPVEEAS